MDKILLIEDDEALAIGIEFSLNKEGFLVKTTRTIEKAYDSYYKEVFQLILLDVILPDGNGYDFCKKIRQESNIPIIFLTACDDEVNIVLGLDIGGDDYITKPFRVKELVSRIKAAIRRIPNENNLSTKVKSKEITVYPLETKALKKDSELYLTSVEYKLLLLFIQNPLQTLTRETILEKLWDVDGEFVTDNNLSVFIRRLREKLEDNPSSPEYIVTIRGTGYKWNQKITC